MAEGGAGRTEPVTVALWNGWWVVRWDQRLVHIEADDARDAIQGSIEALRGLGDWTEDAHRPAGLHPGGD